jgi:hypothetical protein
MEHDMKMCAVFLGSAMLAVSGTAIFAQQQPHQQYDSLGSPTSRPNQEASPNQTEPNVPITGKEGMAATPEPSTTSNALKGKSLETSTTGSSTHTPGMTKNGETPSGLTPD